MKLLDGVTADTTGSSNEVRRRGQGHLDFTYAFYVWSSDFGAGTVTLQVSPDNINWFTARRQNESQAITTVSDVMMVKVRAGYVRAKLTGATAPAALTAMLI